MTTSSHEIRVGCSGWNYASWRHGVFYPEGLPARRWLAVYAEQFDTVEVNTTFYRLPKREAVERWAQETPEGFLFAVKVSRYLTHIKRLREAHPDIRIWTAAIDSHLNDHGYIVPGLGDAGDRMYGTK